MNQPKKELKTIKEQEDEKQEKKNSRKKKAPVEEKEKEDMDFEWGASDDEGQDYDVPTEQKKKKKSSEEKVCKKPFLIGPFKIFFLISIFRNLRNLSSENKVKIVMKKKILALLANQNQKRKRKNQLFARLSNKKIKNLRFLPQRILIKNDLMKMPLLKLMNLQRNEYALFSFSYF
jgi:hypothetical protein